MATNDIIEARARGSGRRRSGRPVCFRHRLSVAILAGLLAMTGFATASNAAVAEFFWAGFNLSDPKVDAASVETVLYQKVDPAFRSEGRGAIAALLGGLEWDEFSYFETASSTGYVKENMRDVYGVFISIDRVMRFKPNVAQIGDKLVRKYYTYVFVTLNIFAADTRNLVFSHPVFLTDVFNQPTDLEQTLEVALGKLAAELKSPGNPFTQKIRQRIQAYYGPPGTSFEAIRRTPKPIQTIDDYFANTFGVMEVCDECVAVMDKSGMTEPDAATMGDFTRFFLNSKLAEYRQVAFLPEQSQTVSQRTGDAAATAKEGDIKRDFSELCLPEYDETGKSRICVKVLPPRNPIWVGVRSLVKPDQGTDSLVELAVAAVVDIEAELAGQKDPFETQLAEMAYVTSAPRGTVASNVIYINALIKAVNKLNEQTIR